MPSYKLTIADGRVGVTEIEARNSHEALNAALNAMAQFACKNFPPPENLSITVAEASGEPVATLSFAFTIDYAQGAM